MSADLEFNEAFLQTFYSFMSPKELLDSLKERYDGVTRWEGGREGEGVERVLGEERPRIKGGW